MTRPAGAVAERECAVFLRHGFDPDALRPPAGISLPGGRRALRVRPAAVEHAFESDTLWLRFTLPAGSYATVLVDALLCEAVC